MGEPVRGEISLLESEIVPHSRLSPNEDMLKPSGGDQPHDMQSDLPFNFRIRQGVFPPHAG